MDEALKQILLPLLGGFLAVVVNWRLRFVALRSTGEKIFLICAVLGVAFATLAHIGQVSVQLVVEHMHGQAAFLSMQSGWRKFSPFAFSQISAFLLGPVMASVANRVAGWDRDSSFDWAMDRLGDNLDGLLRTSRKDRKLVLMSLRCGRVYVGIVQQQTDSAVGDDYVKFYPFLSGFRTPLDIEETNGGSPGGIVFTTFYEDLIHVTKALANSPNSNLDLDEVTVSDEYGRAIAFNPQYLKIVVPKQDIESATMFDPSVYAFLNRHTKPEKWEMVVGPPPRVHEPADDVAQ